MVPSTATRERAIARLRDGYACGTLGTATLDRRIDVALRTPHREALRGLTVDLPAVGPWWRRAGSALTAALAPGRGPRSVGGLLASAGVTGGELTLGRSARCTLVLADETVSRRHAVLRLRDGRWYLVDLDSRNGTWVNGRRTFHAEVASGDEIHLGAVRLRL